MKEVLSLFKSHTAKFFFLMLMLSTIFSAFSNADPEVIRTNISLDVITLILYLFMLHFFIKEDKKTVFIVVFISLIVLAGSVWYDFLIGLPKYNRTLAESVRKGGFGENPNKAASGIKFLALGVLFFLEHSKTKKYLVITILVATIFITFSRSGTVSAVLILILGTMNNWKSTFQIDVQRLIKSFFRIVILFSVLYVALLTLAGVIRENFPAFTRGAAGERMDLLLGQSDKGVIAEDTGSGGGRGDLFLKYMDDFMSNPLGYGTGFTDDREFNSLNTHNQYLYLAVNYGILGLVLYLWLIGYGIKISISRNQFYCFVFYSLFVFEGLIAHNVFYERAVLICVAFFDSLNYGEKYFDETLKRRIYNEPNNTLV
ncbi:O-antigen ligase family protein [Flagellimonas olearia]|nr:O-antigen ligase family protein [Allomuricauda olearia]